LIPKKKVSKKKVSKKKDITPRSKVRQALRLLSLRSRERAACLKRDNYSCQVCGIKQSKAKGKEVSVEVHHVNGARIESIVDLVYEHLLCNPDNLLTVCKCCHEKITSQEIA
jgi:5-methylcytosine-specific restriction endonuclease McrA